MSENNNPLQQLVEGINRDSLEDDLRKFLEGNEFPQTKVGKTMWQYYNILYDIGFRGELLNQLTVGYQGLLHQVSLMQMFPPIFEEEETDEDDTID